MTYHEDLLRERYPNFPPPPSKDSLIDNPDSRVTRLFNARGDSLPREDLAQCPAYDGTRRLMGGEPFPQQVHYGRWIVTAWRFNLDHDDPAEFGYAAFLPVGSWPQMD